MTDTAAAIRLPNFREALATSTTLIGRCVETLSSEDPGLFGPGSVSWRIHRHPAYGLSAIAALLLEALHPTAMAAIDRHSDYRRDAWRRAHRTADYVFTITFSARPTAQAAADRVRAIHRQVQGVDGSGRHYRADDPDLLAWIHCANTEMALRGHETFGPGLTREEADLYVLEQVRAGVLVGLAAETLPASRDALEAVLAGYELRLTPAAAEFASLLLGSRMPWTMRPFWAMHVFGAIRLLPEEARRLYGFTPDRVIGGAGVGAIRAALASIDRGYGLFRPVRAARRKLRLIERLSNEPAPRA